MASRKLERSRSPRSRCHCTVMSSMKLFPARRRPAVAASFDFGRRGFRVRCAIFNERTSTPGKPSPPAPADLLAKISSLEDIMPYVMHMDKHSRTSVEALYDD